MTDRELMQQALEALELHAEQYPHMQKGYTVDAITALRERLAQPEHEPVAWADMDVRGEDKGLSWTPGHFHETPLYTAPQPAQEHVIDCPRCGHCCPQPNQSWNELTDDEMKQIQMQSWNNYPEQHVSKFDAWRCQRLTQDKLREKNA